VSFGYLYILCGSESTCHQSVSVHNFTDLKIYAVNNFFHLIYSLFPIDAMKMMKVICICRIALLNQTSVISITEKQISFFWKWVFKIIGYLQILIGYW